MKPQPFLVPEDLGIDLEEDSENFTEQEAALAVETESQDDFVAKSVAYIKECENAMPSYELLRRAGILYCRLYGYGAANAERFELFRLPWLRRES